MADHVKYNTFTDHEQPPPPHPSGSKRKRAPAVHELTNEDTVQGEEGGFSPKRAKHLGHDGGESPLPGRNIRRKKGKYSLLTLHRHHAPSKQRPSKFKEGSMNDKPSEQPPSVFIRAPSTDQGGTHASDLDFLMGEYHDGAAGMRQSIEQELPIAYSSRVVTVPAEEAADKESGFYKFGRMVASSFNPVNVWKSFAKTFDETRDEMTIANIEENRRKVAQKTLAKQRYAEMKEQGDFETHGYTAVKEEIVDEPEDQYQDGDQDRDQDDLEHARPARDSAVVVPYGTAQKSDEAIRLPDHTEFRTLHSARDDVETPVPSVYSDRTIKSRRSLFHIRRPSFNSIKRVRSDYSLTNALPAQHTPSSLSPGKPALVESSTLHHSHSKRDLNRQHKLNKRVSDLESKLNEARRELTVAITNASPLPELPSRFEKYTPKFKVARPKFVPGALPSLPSERLLFPSLRRRPQNISQTSIHKASQEDVTSSRKQNTDDVFDDPVNITGTLAQSTQGLNIDFEHITAMDPSSYMTDDVQPAEANATSSTLDEKLDALEASHKASQAIKKGNKSKKRKSLGDDEKPFEPLKDDNDDAEWEEGTKPKKKRKAAAKNDATSKKEPTGKKIANKAKPAPKNHQSKPLPPTPAEDVIDDGEEHEARPRTSLDSILQPIYEEESVVGASTGNANALAPPMSQTSRNRSRSPANFSRMSARSHSPDPGAAVSQDAAEVDQGFNAQAQRSSPPPASPEYSRPDEVVDETITAVPGAEYVPSMPAPSSRAEARQAQGAREQWAWPEDIF